MKIKISNHKHIFVLLVTFFSFKVCAETSLTLQIQNHTSCDHIILYYSEVNYAYDDHNVEIFPDDNGLANLTPNIHKGSFFVITFKKEKKIEYLQFYLNPNTTNHLTIDAENPTKTHNFKGDDMQTNYLLQTLNNEHIHLTKLKNVTFSQPDDPLACWETLHQMHKKEKNQLDLLVKGKKIDKRFLTLTKLDIELKYISYFSNYACKQYENSAHFDLWKKQWFKVVWPYFQQDAVDLLTSIEYLNLVSICWNSDILTTMLDFQVPPGGFQTIEELYTDIFALLEKKQKKGAFALLSFHCLGYELFQNSFETSLINLSESYIKKFPQYTQQCAYLEKAIAPIKAFNDLANQDPNNESIQFVAQENQANTLQVLLYNLNPTKDLVYIDLWATWCGPCKAEFTHLKTLKKALDLSKVDFLYISTDREDRHEKWKQMVQYYDLSGYHVRANAALAQDIEQCIAQIPPVTNTLLNEELTAIKARIADGGFLIPQFLLAHRQNGQWKIYYAHKISSAQLIEQIKQLSN